MKRPSNHALIIVLRACQDLHVAADMLAHYGVDGATKVANYAFLLQTQPTRSAAALAAAAVMSVRDHIADIDAHTTLVVLTASDSCMEAFEALPH